jgi:hypothetical protein
MPDVAALRASAALHALQYGPHHLGVATVFAGPVEYQPSLRRVETVARSAACTRRNLPLEVLDDLERSRRRRSSCRSISFT